jgi:hypothetical protein
MRDRVARSVGALLIARKGRADCPGLQVVLADWDGTYTVLTRKRVARHIDRCELCDERRAALVAPFGALAVGPALATFTLPDGALDGVRDRVLAAFDQRAVGGPSEPGAVGPPLGGDRPDGDGPDDEPLVRRRRLLAALGAAALILAVVIGIVATRSDDESQALRTDEPSTATTTSDGPRATTTTAARTTSTTKTGPVTTTTVTATTPNQSGSTTVPGDVVDPADPAGGPQATVPPSVGGPAVTVVPTTAAPTAPNQPPAVGATSRTPAGATMQTSCNPANDRRTVSVAVSDDRGVVGVVLRWTQSGGGSGERAMSRSGGTWSAPLGPFANPGTITYRAVATDSNGVSAASPSASIGVDPCPG